MDSKPSSGQSPDRGDRPSLLTTASETLVCGLLGGISWFITDVLNNTTVYNAHRFHDAYNARPPGQGIITVSNHVTAVDDPGTTMPLIPGSWLLKPEKLRWTLCASDRCFNNPVTSALLTAGRALPVERGKGPLQPAMDAVVRKLERGDWVHMFPEGSRQPYGAGLGQMRPGVGRLIADAVPTPVVVPFYHRGLHQLHQKGDLLPVHFNKRIDIAVGQPIDFAPMLRQLRSSGAAERDIHMAVSNRIGQSLAELRVSLRLKREAKAFDFR